MSDSALQSRSALAGIASPGRHGRQEGEPGLVISERADLGLATVAARKGQEEALRAAVQESYDVTLPDRPRAAAGPLVQFIGTAPGQWLAVSERLANEALARDLGARLKGLASVVDQSGGRAVLRLSGPRAREVLAKGLPIDLHPRAFAPGDAATSVIGFMGAQIWQVDEAPTYDIAVFRSLSESFWHWLTASAAEFGYEVVAEG